jgi:hypothetical protein
MTMMLDTSNRRISIACSKLIRKSINSCHGKAPLRR